MRKRISHETRGKSSKHIIRPLEYQILFNSPYVPPRMNIKDFYNTSIISTQKNYHNSPFTIKKLRPHSKWRGGKKLLTGIQQKSNNPIQAIERNFPFRHISQQNNTIDDIVFNCFSNPERKITKRKIFVKPLSKKYKVKQNLTMQNFVNEDINLHSLHESVKKNLSNYISVISSNKYKVPFTTHLVLHS